MSIASSINAINEAGKRRDKDAIANVLTEVKVSVVRFFVSYSLCFLHKQWIKVKYVNSLSVLT